MRSTDGARIRDRRLYSRLQPMNHYTIVNSAKRCSMKTKKELLFKNTKWRHRKNSRYSRQCKRICKPISPISLLKCCTRGAMTIWRKWPSVKSRSLPFFRESDFFVMKVPVSWIARVVFMKSFPKTFKFYQNRAYLLISAK